MSEEFSLCDSVVSAELYVLRRLVPIGCGWRLASCSRRSCVHVRSI